MKNTKHKYLTSKNYIIRTPLLPISEVKNLNLEKIKELCQKQYISEAIYIASPELHKEMSKLLEGKDVRDKEKLIYSIIKYLIRMSYRCTPFGLFSGCAIGSFSDVNDIKIKSIESHGRITRLDMDFLCSLSQIIESNKNNRDSLLYFKNSSLYKIGNELRYVEYRYTNNIRKHFTVSIDFSDILNHIFNYIVNGAKFKEIVLEIVKIDSEIPLSVAEEFVNELISSQIIISSVSPALTGNGYFDILANFNLDDVISQQLSKIKKILSEINNRQIGEGFLLYQNLINEVKSLNIGFKEKYLLQTDLAINYESNEIRQSIAKRAISAFEFLNKLNQNSSSTKLTKFREVFYKKYEDEELSLATVLDVESGIGYPVNTFGSFDISPLIDDLKMSYRNVDEDSLYHEIKWNKKDEFLNQKMRNIDWNKENTLELKDSDLSNFQDNWDDLPDTFSVMISVLEIDKDSELIYFDFAGGATASNLLGRFCHLNSEIEYFVRELIKKEENKKSEVYAEIVHLPEKRAGNILYRPQLREYEIPYLAKSNLNSSKQIHLDDIMISIKNNKIVLRSKKLNKNIIPRMATAHNYTFNSLPVYHFLCDLQYQNIRQSTSFSWGNLNYLYSRFPRVVYNGIILSLALWNIDRDTIKMFNSDRNSLKDWLKTNKVPKKVNLEENDNKLLIDFDHELSVEMFLSTIKNKHQITLTEYKFNPDKPLVSHEDKAFTNEIIMAFYKND